MECLDAKADGTKLPPMTIFKNAKQQVDAMDKEFKNCIIASSPNAWINAKVWNNNVLGSFSIHHRHLVWDSFECKMKESVKY